MIKGIGLVKNGTTQGQVVEAEESPEKDRMGQ
jgi:hypothetical protein